MEMFKHAIEIHQLPKTLEQALITVLLKPGKDPKLCGSYRPIALVRIQDIYQGYSYQTGESDP